MDKDTALLKFATSRQELLQAIEGLNQAEMTGPAVEGIWTIKDLLAHITSWEEACLIPLKDFTEGKPFVPEDIPDDLAWNDQQAQLWHKLDLETILERLAHIRQEILDELDRLPDIRWEQVLPLPWREQGSLVNMISGLAWHENEHVKCILRWLAETVR